MMRAKRPRALLASQSHANGHSGHSRMRSMSDDNLGDDYLLHMDLSLMTERQQLAFLLRTTAHEQSGGDSQSSDSSEDEEAAKRPKKRIQHAKTSPRNMRKTTASSSSANSHANKTAASTPRGRPRKGAVKTHPVHGEEAEVATSKSSTRANKSSARRLQVKTISPTASELDDDRGHDHAADSSNPHHLDAKASIRKPSPSSTSDIAHMDVFDGHLNRVDLWSSHCALCSASASELDAACGPLFLCQSCDKKYPTQRALGRV